jgi:glyoxylase I family protein
MTTTTPQAVAASERADRPVVPSGLSHVAYVTHDTAATVDFYRRLLGMELVNAVLDDTIPSTGDPVPYFHSFFRMGDGSTIAFFEAPDLPPAPADAHPAYNVFRHLALEADSPATIDAWKAWLVRNGVDVLGPVDHTIIYSIYFHDPNGIRLEITAPLSPSWNDSASSAQVAFEEWEAIKRSAGETGSDMVAALAEHTRRKSHQRSGQV